MHAAISYSFDHQLENALYLAKQLNLPILEPNQKKLDASLFWHDRLWVNLDFLLNYNQDDELELQIPNQSNFRPLKVDFTSGKIAHRYRFGGGRKQTLARAVGLHKEKNLFIFDPTAGLGNDSFILAYLGAKVLMTERNPIIAALLEDGLKRAENFIFEHNLSIKLIAMDGQKYLKALDPVNFPEVIYLDPMFPENKQAALVKKEMRILRKIVGKDQDANQLLEIALKTATRRVVVKRPRLADCLPGPKPNLQMIGKSNRYDIYLII